MVKNMERKMVKRRRKKIFSSLVFIQFLDTILMIEKPIYIKTFFFVL